MTGRVFRRILRILDLHNHVVLFRAGDWIFVTYGLLAGAAFFLGFSAGLWYDAMSGQGVQVKARMYVLFVLPAILLGARAFSVLLEWRMLLRNPLSTLLKPGYMLHGGLYGGVTAFVLWSSFSEASLPLLLDSAAFAMPLGEAVCRLGCYVYGCCWGKPTRIWLGIRYESADAKVVRHAPELRGVKIHPVQLYSSVLHLIQFVMLYALLPYKSFDGMFAIVYSTTHPILRFVMERLRYDDRGKVFAGVTHTHLYSSIQFVLALIFLTYWRRAGANTPLHLNVGWMDSLADPVALGCLSLLTLVVIISFGIHYRKVGSWLPQPRWRAAQAAVIRADIVDGNRAQ